MSDKTPKKQTEEKRENSEEVATSVPATTEQTKRDEAGKDVGAGAANIDNFLIPDGLNPRTKNDRIFNGVSVSTIPGTALKGNIVTEAANLAKLANTRQFFNKTDFATAVVLKVFEITDEAVALMKLRGHSRRLQLTTSRTAPQDTSVIGMQNTDDPYEGLLTTAEGGTNSPPAAAAPAAAGGDSDGQPQMPLVMVYAACDRYHTSGPNLNGDNMDAVYEFYGPPFFALSNRKLKQGDLIEVKYLSEEPYGSGIWKDDYIAQQQRFLGGSGMNMLGAEVEGGVKLGNGKKAHERISFPIPASYQGAVIAQREFNNWGHFVKHGPEDKRTAYPYMFTEADREAITTLVKYWRAGANSHIGSLVEDPTNIYIKYVPHFRKEGSETETKSYRGKKYPLIWTSKQVQKKDFTWQVNDKSASGQGHIPGASDAGKCAWSSAFITYCMRHDPTFEQFGLYIKGHGKQSRKLEGRSGKWNPMYRGGHNYYFYAGMVHTMMILAGKPNLLNSGMPWLLIPRPQDEKNGPWEKNYGNTIFKRISKYVTVQKAKVGVEVGDIAALLAVIHGVPGSYHGDIVVLGDKGMKNKNIPIPERWLNCIVNKNSAKYPPKRGDAKKKGKATKKDAKNKKTKSEAKKASNTAPAFNVTAGASAGNDYFQKVQDDVEVSAGLKTVKGKFTKEEYDAMRQKAIDEKLVFKIGGNVSGGPAHSGGSPGMVGLTYSRTDAIFTRRPECIRAVTTAAAKVSAEDKSWFAEQLKRFDLKAVPGGVYKRTYDVNGNKIGKGSGDPATAESSDEKESAKGGKKKPKRKAKKKEESKTPPAKK